MQRDAAAVTSPTKKHADRAGFWLVIGIASIVHWIPYFPPQIDLAQHAGQLRLLRDWTNPTFRYRDFLELNFFTPYLPAYLIGTLLTFGMSALAAVKLLWTVSVIGMVYATVRLRRTLGGDSAWDWFMLFGFFGVTFQWGFLTFLFVVPFGILLVEQWVHHLRNPSRRTFLVIAAALIVLFFSHALVTAWTMSVCAMMLLSSLPLRRSAMLSCARHMLPLLAPLPFAVLWVRSTRDLEQARTGVIFSWDTRYREFLPQWFGLGEQWFMLIAASILLTFMVFNGARLTRDPIGRAPLIVTVAILLFWPDVLYGNAFTYNRFFTLLGPSLVCALVKTTTPTARLGVRHLVLPAVAIAWVIGWSVRMMNFATEQQGFVRMVNMMEPNRRTLNLKLDPANDFTHFPVWYQAERGGLVEPSFASYLPMIVRFRAREFESVPMSFAQSPAITDVRRLANFYYIIVRTADTAAPSPGLKDFALKAHEGNWWLYERKM